MKTQPKVSILVPVYGVEGYIARCAVSLLEQSYENLEFIFVDDATKDSSIGILEETISEYPERMPQCRILHHEVNRGLSAARNTAVAAASGEYLLHVDSDDYLAPRAIEKLVEAADGKADIVLFDTIELREDGEHRLNAEYRDRTGYIKGLLQHTNRCAHWNKFYRSAFYLGSGISSIESIRLAEDYAVTPRLVHKAESIKVLHEPLYYYETRNQNSYVHNLNRAAVESQHEADTVLTDYFGTVADKSTWADVVGILPQRTVVSLVKRAGEGSWELIRDVYADEMSLSGAGMKVWDRVIFDLFRKKRYGSLSIVLSVYRKLICLI